MSQSSPLPYPAPHIHFALQTSTDAQNHNHHSLRHNALHYDITLHFAPLTTILSAPVPPDNWLWTIPATTNWFWVGSLYGCTGAPATPCNTSNARDKLWCIFLSSPRDPQVGFDSHLSSWWKGIAGMRGWYKEIWIALERNIDARKAENKNRR